MKTSGLKLSILAAMLLSIGCAGATDEIQAQPGDSCTADTCMNESTQLICHNGQYVSRDCEYGCDGNACKEAPAPETPGVCTSTTCADSMTLSRCVDGTPKLEICAYGCENGACKPSTPEASCLASVCQDNDTLLACLNGTQSVVPCPYGCEKGTCQQACTSDLCLNAGTLLKCTNGRTQSITCQFGCEMGACLNACDSNFCRDEKTLMVCNNGHTKPVDCPYGCNAGKCNSSNSSAQCTEDVCANTMTLHKCVNGTIQAQACQYGCANSACKEPQCTQTVCGDSNTLNLCNNGVIQTVNCPFGCANGECQKENKPQCTTSVCANASLLNECINGQYVTRSCPNGCENGACKTSGGSSDGKPGDSCVTGEYQENCKGEVVYYCSDNVITTMDCSEYASKGYACKAFNMPDGSSFANCLSAAESCTSVNANHHYCEPYSYYGNVEFEETCVKSYTDNKNYWVTTDLALCATATQSYGGQCNADGTACANPSDSGNTSTYYDCSDEICTQDGDTCVEACNAAGYSTNQAWCDDEYFYCENPSGGNSGGGTSTGPSVAKNSCNLSSTKIKAIEPFGECTTSNEDCEVHVCWLDSQYNTYFTEYLVCMDLSAYDPSYGYMWYPVDGIYMQCNNKCATSSQACDSQGGQYGQYQ